MSKAVYINLKDISLLQQNVMAYVTWWVKTEKTPVPRKEIITEMTKQGVKSFTTILALNVLERKGYIRKSVIASNKTLYVQLRGV